jgi:hypothetical protein
MALLTAVTEVGGGVVAVAKMTEDVQDVTKVITVVDQDLPNMIATTDPKDDLDVMTMPDGTVTKTDVVRKAPKRV